MRNIFIVNPCAGKGLGNESFIQQVRTASDKLSIPVEIYKTKAILDGEKIVSDICDKRNAEGSSEELRFFACGGDGTLNEVVNGAFGYENVSVGCIPIGTGNDFVRNFKNAGDFYDIESQLKGTPQLIDLIEYTGAVPDASSKKGVSANMFNIGFDCNVVVMTNKLKKYPLVSGSFAYLLGVAAIFIKKEGANLKIETLDSSANSTTLNNGPLLLTTIANGSFCGGGVMSNPDARLDDGLFDLQIIQDIPRRTFVQMFPKYVKGTHLNTKIGQKYINYSNQNHIKITALEKPMLASIDGELYPFETLELKNLQKCMSFSVPAKTL